MTEQPESRKNTNKNDKKTGDLFLIDSPFKLAVQNLSINAEQNESNLPLLMPFAIKQKLPRAKVL